MLENEMAHSVNSIRWGKKLFKWTSSIINTLKAKVLFNQVEESYQNLIK